ncbi:MAG: phosphogluconate dehydrogenase (NAD(+)-dependent, decarboxylating) [Acidimicrobiales bacterium]
MRRDPTQPARTQLGMVGLGRMGANLSRRLMAHGHEMVVFDIHPEAVVDLAGEGAVGADNLEDLLSRLDPPRAVWLMLPAAVTGSSVEVLSALMEPGDVIIDGGNSYYRDDIIRSRDLAQRGIGYLDVGTSGGVFGLERGFCLMVGGEVSDVDRLSPVFEALAPGLGAAPRTPGRQGAPAPEERGWLHCGGAGAGHFVKMVHNGIEYGAMASLAEGLAILERAGIGLSTRPADAETAPLASPELYQYRFDLAAVAEVWRRGSVVSSWLLDLTAAALMEEPGLGSLSGRVSDSGEGRWTVLAAVEEGVPAPVLSAALFERFASRGEGDFANKVLSAMRRQFGGHHEKPVPADEGVDEPTASPGE